LHASYGVGAAASPLIVTAVLGTDATWRWAYATAERTSPAVADRMIGFQASASALGAGVIPLLIGLVMGVSAGALALVIAPLCLTAALLCIAMQMHQRR
jgi:hypothetical protein